MKKILVLSDTHGNNLFLRQAIKNEIMPDYIFHLGDYYEDLDNNADIIENIKTYRVPGIFHNGYFDGSIDFYKIINVETWNFLLIHDQKDIFKIDFSADVILHGHTHIPEFKILDKYYKFNPGHLKQSLHRGSYAGYLLLEIDKNSIVYFFKELSGKIYKEGKIKKI